MEYSINYGSLSNHILNRYIRIWTNFSTVMKKHHRIYLPIFCRVALLTLVEAKDCPNAWALSFMISLSETHLKLKYREIMYHHNLFCSYSIVFKFHTENNSISVCRAPCKKVKMIRRAIWVWWTIELSQVLSLGWASEWYPIFPQPQVKGPQHYNDIIMSVMASQITSLTIFTQPFIQAQIKGTSKLRVTGLCEGNSPVTGEFPAQRASNA